jgi:hypothetical protein
VNAPTRFVLFAVSSLLVVRAAGAQDAPAEPAPVPSDAPLPTEPPPTEPPPAPPPPAEQPTPAPAERAPPPLLAPLPPAPPAAKPATGPLNPAPTRAAPAPTERAASEAPPAPTESAKQPAQPSEKKQPDDDSSSRDGLFGPFRIGLLVGGGLPSLLSFGGEIRLTRYFGAGVRVGLIPAVHFSYYGDATVSYQDYGAYAHLHPLGGGFLLGAELGYALVKGTYQSKIQPSQVAVPGLPSSIDVTSSGSVQTAVLTPEIGYIFTWPAGFTFGFDAGAQIPVAPSHVTLTDHISVSGVPAALTEEYITPRLAPAREKVRTTLEKVGQTVLPAFHLRIGWLL